MSVLGAMNLPFKLMAHLIGSSFGLARGPRRRFAPSLIFRGVLFSNGGTSTSLSLLGFIEALPQVAGTQHHHVAEPEGQERGVEVPDLRRGHVRNAKMLSRLTQRLGSVRIVKCIEKVHISTARQVRVVVKYPLNFASGFKMPLMIK